MAARARRVVRVLAAFAPFAMLLGGCADREAPDDVVHPVRGDEVVRVSSVGEALAGAHLPTLDPATLDEAQIRKVLGTGPRCDFRYTATGKPVLSMRTGAGDAVLAGLVALNGHLVRLDGASAPRAGAETWPYAMGAGPVRIAIAPDSALPAAASQRIEATAVFEVGDSLRVGYRGYLDCVAASAGEAGER